MTSQLTAGQLFELRSEPVRDLADQAEDRRGAQLEQLPGGEL